MRVIGNVFITIGVLLCMTIVGIFWGLPIVAVGALLRIASRGPASQS